METSASTDKASDPDAQPQEPASHFLRLAPELRILIYRHLLVTPIPIWIGSQRLEKSPVPPLNILLVNKLISSEAAEVLYTENTFATSLTTWTIPGFAPVRHTAYHRLRRLELTVALSKARPSYYDKTIATCVKKLNAGDRLRSVKFVIRNWDLCACDVERVMLLFKDLKVRGEVIVEQRPVHTSNLPFAAFNLRSSGGIGHASYGLMSEKAREELVRAMEFK
ncbi:hypothetical protein W97_08968 [Coniosporium apollinis CBS 100218]|uniref:Uncharacterized protein n=1 Tax=Coniosporium apollinis (strain CBS 100218) TaxID=1168221 RepID=R7Z6I0_CONA1|nr:uncharacterized protein W97_08968 [Coniosporium apollinis CBS 100218]EON69708.1 hypothetical protein W97_08968 [Coniosporium apollinis CBS 100218]